MRKDMTRTAPIQSCPQFGNPTWKNIIKMERPCPGQDGSMVLQALPYFRLWKGVGIGQSDRSCGKARNRVEQAERCGIARSSWEQASNGLSSGYVYLHMDRI